MRLLSLASVLAAAVAIGVLSPAASAQSRSDRTLEIAPQLPPQPDTKAQPSDDTSRYRSSKEEGAPGRDLYSEPIIPESRGKPPYLGIAARYAVRSYLGQEQHGLEVVSVDPGSPAARAGLEGPRPLTAVGAAGKTASTMLAPLNVIVEPLLRKTGSLGEGGDFIVAVDDHRVHSDLDLANELGQLKPGDTIYLTVIRWDPHGKEKSVKIPVKLDAPRDGLATAPSPNDTSLTK